MATTSVSSASLQNRQKEQNCGRKAGAESASGGRVKAGLMSPGVKRECRNNQRDKGGAGKRAGAAGRVKRKWRPNQEHKVFEGSAKEGQGFALWRKKKVQLEYKKLQRKQKKTNTNEVSYTDHYPEHLKHLYLAEAERLKRDEKRRKPDNEPSETVDEEKEVILKKKFKKKTSNQKAQDDYERVKRERAKKREEAENNRRKKEEALKLYKQRKMEAFKAISSKTKKGQPNFNVQMEYLLKKIQSKP